MLENTKQIVSKEKIAEFCKKNKIRKLSFFGSALRDDFGPDSDVDIFIEVDPSIGLDFITLAERIEKMLGTTVDLVSSRAVSSRAMKFIESELIYV